MTTLAEMTTQILLYTSYDDPDFVAEIPRFIQSSEERCWFFAQLPAYRDAQVGSMRDGGAARADTPGKHERPWRFPRIASKCASCERVSAQPPPEVARKASRLASAARCLATSPSFA